MSLRGEPTGAGDTDETLQPDKSEWQGAGLPVTVLDKTRLRQVHFRNLGEAVGACLKKLKLEECLVGYFKDAKGGTRYFTIKDLDEFDVLCRAYAGSQAIGHAHGLAFFITDAENLQNATIT